jgi:hypothetical protein
VLAGASYRWLPVDRQDLTAPKPSRLAGVMDKFKLEPIRISKEHGIVPGTVCWIFGRRIEDGRFPAHQKRVQTVYVGAVYRIPGQMMQPNTVPIVLPIRPGRLEANGAKQAVAAGQIPIHLVWPRARAPVAEKAQHRFVKSRRDHEVAHGKVDVMDGPAHACPATQCGVTSLRSALILLMRRAPGDWGGAAGNRPARRHGESGGGPRLREELNSSFPQWPSSPSLRLASFQSGNSLSNSHADGLNGGQETCLFSKEMRSSTLRMGSDIAITQ